jgi:hypothetical protein
MIGFDALLQGTLFGLLFIILLVKLVHLVLSWEHASNMMSPTIAVNCRTTQIYQQHDVVFFLGRVALIISTVLFLALLGYDSDSNEGKVKRSF